ncbi:putative DNA-binding domain-containing protein [Celeribacter baekdonensis]|uniref:HvfC/BufC family peptide modification chaperone n=1 Tax=Celeribacter baekdonensis TaxID=875171 RepID=UPI003A8C9A4E
MTQSAFIHAVLNPDAPVPTGLTDASGRPASARFNVYRNNVTVSLKEALSSGFPAIKSLLGTAFFDAMTGTYLRAHPPKSPRLALYGETFPDFLAGFDPLRHLPYLPDIARLEYALRQSYHAADTTALTPDALQTPEALIRPLRLAPSVFWIESAYPVTQIHAAAFGGPNPTGGAETALVTRAIFDPVATGFPPGTSAVLMALNAGTSLDEALTVAPPLLDLSVFLSALLTGGALTLPQDTAHV